jgi:heat shock protein HtpX
LGLIFTLLAIIFIPIASMLTQLAISRKREFLADASGVLLTRYPDGLISALEKIDNSNIPLRYVSNTTRSLFIADPYKKKSMSWFQKI